MSKRKKEKPSADPWFPLLALTGAAAFCYAVLLFMGPWYALKTNTIDRPILWVIGIYAVAFVPCWLATRLAARMPDSRRLVGWIIGSSVLFRLLMLPTPPLQEIDIYRYLWDGAVIANGENPYRYALDEIKQGISAIDQGQRLNDPRLEYLAKLAVSEPGLRQVVSIVHQSDLASCYPPVSQAVFTAPALVTPSDWSGIARLNLLKFVLTLFDVGTLLVVLSMLRQLGLPLGLAVAYGWCPLVIKEIANSGHLDSIAIFFATAALGAGFSGLSARKSKGVWGGLLGSAVLLALGVAAKLYPVVLAPLLVIVFGRRLGWTRSAAWATLFAITAAAAMAPMAIGFRDTPEAEAARDAQARRQASLASDASLSELPPAPGVPDAAVANAQSGRPKNGLTTFLSSFEMNDLAFMVVFEQLRSNDNYEDRYRPWFDAFEDKTSQATVDAWSRGLEAIGLEVPGEPAFAFTRLITLSVFGVITLTLAWRASTAGDLSEQGLRLMRAAFLTLAWFWLLAPTQNPWYWCWAVPLLPFARLRAWHALAACSLLYYTRFWLEVHFEEPGVLGTPYDGKYFFYFVIAWVEFFPWLVALAIEAWYRRGESRTATL